MQHSTPLPDRGSTTPRPARRTAVALACFAALGCAASIAVVEPTAASAGTARRACTSSPSTHTVNAGESWFSVAASAGVTTTSLLRANDAKASATLYPGDVLCLPAGATAPATTAPTCSSTHQVVAGDSWAALATAAGVSIRAVLTANSATADTVLHPGDSVCLPAGATPVSTANACASKRTVSSGESWYVISRSAGVPMNALLAANKAQSSSVLYAGQSVCLPEVGFGRNLSSMLLHVDPVRGACRFANSWMASRGNRFHVGVDLISPAGTPVVAVGNGTLTRQTKGSSVSGNAWWLTTSSGTYFFYAHLSAFADGLTVGSRVKAGDTIGYVGSTGNAVSPHLHFEIHPYGGGPVNPYDAIWMLGGCRFDARYEQIPLS